MTVTIKIVDEPIVHVVRDAKLFEFVQHRGMTNCVEGLTEIKNEVKYCFKTFKLQPGKSDDQRCSQ